MLSNLLKVLVAQVHIGLICENCFLSANLRFAKWSRNNPTRVKLEKNAAIISGKECHLQRAPCLQHEVALLSSELFSDAGGAHFSLSFLEWTMLFFTILRALLLKILSI
jgi:hypothetical protein